MSGGTEESQGNMSGNPVSRLRFEISNSRIQAQRTATPGSSVESSRFYFQYTTRTKNITGLLDISKTEEFPSERLSAQGVTT
jgi:hypothetical protein